MDGFRKDGVEPLLQDVRYRTHGAKKTSSPVWFTVGIRETQAREDRFGFRLEGSQSMNNGCGVYSRAVGRKPNVGPIALVKVLKAKAVRT